MTKFVVLGTGLLGSALLQQLEARGMAIDGLDHAAIDAAGGLCRAASAIACTGDVVINAAGMTSVDECEDRRADAMEVNGEEPGRLARLCRQLCAKFVQISTDSVLDVTNVYAASKALAEQRVAELGAQDALLIRISTVFGPHATRVDFVRFIVSALRVDGHARAANDMKCSPTYSIDAAKAIIAAVAGGARGVHQFVNMSSITRYDFALEIQRTWQLAGTIHPVPLSSFAFRARRPNDTTMAATLGAWHASAPLRECLEDYRARWP